MHASLCLSLYIQVCMCAYTSIHICVLYVYVSCVVVFTNTHTCMPRNETWFAALLFACKLEGLCLLLYCVSCSVTFSFRCKGCSYICHRFVLSLSSMDRMPSSYLFIIPAPRLCRCMVTLCLSIMHTNRVHVSLRFSEHVLVLSTLFVYNSQFVLCVSRAWLPLCSSLTTWLFYTCAALGRCHTQKAYQLCGVSNMPVAYPLLKIFTTIEKATASAADL